MSEVTQRFLAIFKRPSEFENFTFSTKKVKNFWKDFKLKFKVLSKFESIERFVEPYPTNPSATLCCGRTNRSEIRGRTKWSVRHCNKHGTFIVFVSCISYHLTSQFVRKEFLFHFKNWKPRNSYLRLNRDETFCKANVEHVWPNVFIAIELERIYANLLK